MSGSKERERAHLGSSQLEEKSGSQVMVVSKEYVARQVCAVIRWREKWLVQKGLPRNTLMNEAQEDELLQASKRSDQRELQERDATEGRKQLVDGRKISRWNRHLQRLAGTAQMWHVLSFNGKFDLAFFDGLPPPPPQAGELTDSQRLNDKHALEALGNSWLHKDCAVRLASTGGNGVQSRRTTKSFSARRRERDVG